MPMKFDIFLSKSYASKKRSKQEGPNILKSGFNQLKSFPAIGSREKKTKAFKKKKKIVA